MVTTLLTINLYNNLSEAVFMTLCSIGNSDSQLVFELGFCSTDTCRVQNIEVLLVTGGSDFYSNLMFKIRHKSVGTKKNKLQQEPV